MSKMFFYLERLFCVCWLANVISLKIGWVAWSFSEKAAWKSWGQNCISFLQNRRHHAVHKRQELRSSCINLIWTWYNPACDVDNGIQNSYSFWIGVSSLLSQTFGYWCLLAVWILGKLSLSPDNDSEGEATGSEYGWWIFNRSVFSDLWTQEVLFVFRTCSDWYQMAWS